MTEKGGKKHLHSSSLGNQKSAKDISWSQILRKRLEHHLLACKQCRIILCQMPFLHTTSQTEAEMHWCHLRMDASKGRGRICTTTQARGTQQMCCPVMTHVTMTWDWSTEWLPKFGPQTYCFEACPCSLIHVTTFSRVFNFLGKHYCLLSLFLSSEQ